MKLSAPKKFTFWLTIILALISVLLTYVIKGIPYISGYEYIILLVAFGLLALGNFIKGF